MMVGALFRVPASTSLSDNACPTLTSKRSANSIQMVITVAHRMILQHELAGQRSVAVQRHGRGAIQFFIAKSTNGRSRCRTVGGQQCKRGCPL